MRAVNLVPPESRAGRVSPGKSGGAVYGVIGALVLVLVMLSALAVVKKQKTQAEQELAGIQQSTQAYTQAATQFSSFEQAAQDAQTRIQLVRSLADARFDWAGTLRDLARLIPAHTQISSLDASVKDGAGTGSGSSTFRTQIASSPAITLKGCSTSQSTVADLVTRLQAMRRVTNVTLESSESDGTLGDFNKKIKEVSADAGATASDGGTASGGSGADNGCSLPDPYYQFSITVFYAGGKAQASSDAVPSTPAAASAVATESAGAAVPASTTPGAGN